MSSVVYATMHVVHTGGCTLRTKTWYHLPTTLGSTRVHPAQQCTSLQVTPRPRKWNQHRQTATQ